MEVETEGNSKTSGTMEAEKERTQSTEEKPAKKPRRRMKATYTNIKQQMEFYFSDSNLNKDRFVRKAIDATSDGYIALDVFLSFNKIKTLTGEVSVIADSLQNKSQLLQINEERTHVRRVTPIKEPVNVDERTVYVEYIPLDSDHEWVKKLFSSCGKVAFVSLPRYPSTGDLKGFGFVEFESIDGAQAACQELNNPPADVTQRAGMFPKSSHQMEALKKKLPEDQIKETVEKVKDSILTGHEEQLDTGDIPEARNKNTEKNKETKKRRRTNSGNDASEASPAKRKQNDASEASPAKRKQNDASETSPAKRKQNDASETSPAKRKQSDVIFDLPSQEHKGVEDRTTLNSKKKSRKRKSRSKTADSEESKVDSDLDKSVEVVPEKKQKLEKNVSWKNEDTDSKQTADIRNVGESSGQEQEQSTENPSNKKKRFRRKKDKKEKKEKEFPELRVLPKKEWLVLREEYLKLQKTSMALLKKTLGEQKNGSIKVGDAVKKTTKRKEIEFVADVIVKVSAENPMMRKQLKGALGDGYRIAYIDVKDEQTEGFIRCEDAESASNISGAAVTGYSFSAVTGDEEKLYWDKLTSDREIKLNTKSRDKKRGQQKWTDKAQKASMESVERKHIVFDED